MIFGCGNKVSEGNLNIYSRVWQLSHSSCSKVGGRREKDRVKSSGKIKTKRGEQNWGDEWREGQGEKVKKQLSSDPRKNSVHHKKASQSLLLSVSFSPKTGWHFLDSVEPPQLHWAQPKYHLELILREGCRKVNVASFKRSSVQKNNFNPFEGGVKKKYCACMWGSRI